MPGIAITRPRVQAFVPGANDDIVDELIKGTLARAGMIAPCLLTTDLTQPVVDAAEDILLGCIVRAIEMGTGETTTLIAGPMQQTVDTTKRRAARFRPDEIRDLQSLCNMKKGGAFTISLGYDARDALMEDWTAPDA